MPKQARTRSRAARLRARAAEARLAGLRRSRGYAFRADAWVDETYKDDADRNVGRLGYEINFNRYFYRYVPAPTVDGDRRRAEDFGE